MSAVTLRCLQVGLIFCVWAVQAAAVQAAAVHGGKITIAQRAEPKTLNPVLALDAPSREVIGRMSADLISIDRQTQTTKPVLAESWHISADGLHYTVRLRPGLRFSDGQPFGVEDVLFSFRVYLDEKVHSLQHDLFVIGGKAISVSKVDSHTVRFDLPAPYAPGERIFDSVPMLPRHLLEQAYLDGKLSQTWALNSRADAIAGMGPFRLKEYHPGERLVLERNPYYWKASLPYLDEMDFVFVGDEDAQIARYLTGETDLLNRVSARNVALLRSRGINVEDLGPSLEWNALVFNLTADAKPGVKEWFQSKAFRQAVSAAIDRPAILRLVYGGLATPLNGHVSTGNRVWADHGLPAAQYSVEQAKTLLKGAGFGWDDGGKLHDSAGRTVEFTIATAASNQERNAMATIIQDDLAAVGMKVKIAPLEFRSLVERVLTTHQYDAAMMGLGGGDPDPDAEMNVWLSEGAMHLWNPGQKQPGSEWEAEIDQLMREQASEVNQEKRRKLYDRVQEIEVAQMPMVCLASPHVLVAARERVKNLRAVNLDHYTLWNADELYVADAKAKERHAVQ